MSVKIVRIWFFSYFFDFLFFAFLSVTEFIFQFSINSHKEFVESPALTVADLLAKLGGVMNLWAGITVVVFIEVIETLVRMCVRCARKGKEAKEQEANN